MEAVQAAAEAATNGSEPVEAAATVAQRLGAVTAETGLGFLALSVAVVSTKYSLERFATAFKAAKP